MTEHADRIWAAAQVLNEVAETEDQSGAINDLLAVANALRSTPAAPQTDTALTVERLAEALHSAIACNWRAHSGFTARTDREYHEQQASRILRALGEGAGEGVDRG